MATYMREWGIKGIICDGSIRDYGGISTMEDFRVYARGVTPNGPYKNGPGEINVPVVCSGKTVYPGDIVVADDDGVVVVLLLSSICSGIGVVAMMLPIIIAMSMKAGVFVSRQLIPMSLAASVVLLFDSIS